MGGQASDLGAKCDAMTATFLKHNRLPGAAVGVVHGGELLYARGVGFADVHSGHSCNPQTLYRIASITKTFTATAVMQLRDGGRLRLDDPVVTILPELGKARHPYDPIESITIRRMLSHESGLQRDPPGTDWGCGSYERSVQSTLSRAAEISTRAPAGSEPRYSNLSYQLLGEVVARVAGMPYPEYVRQRILDPLGMRSTSFDPLAEELQRRTATGYDARLFSDQLAVASPFTQFSSEAGLWSCVDDLARWLSFQIEGTTSSDSEVLLKTTRHEMQRPRYLCNESWTAAKGIGWEAVRPDKVTWVQHGGGIYGFVSHMCFDPKGRVGAIALLNGIGDASRLAMDLASIAREFVTEALPSIQHPPAMPDSWKALLGLYLGPFGFMIRLEWRDGKLTIVRLPNEAVDTLSPAETPDVFICDPGGQNPGDPVRFVRATDGRVRSLLLDGTTHARLDPVQ